MTDETEQRRYHAVRARLEAYGQEHLLQFYGELDGAGRQRLLDAAEALDLELITKLYRHAAAQDGPQAGGAAQDVFAPIPVTVRSALTRAQTQRYTEAGLALMRAGRYAALTMAGGQGTRLGHCGPKGTFDIGLPSGESLFQIQCERLKRRARQCGAVIPWYIMTSRENHDATAAFFEAHDWFGYGRDNVTFFRQYMLPMVDFEGRIVLERKDAVREGADGHGGIFRAMAGSGILEDMTRRGVEWVFIGGVDNVLVKLCDPLFLGFLAENGYALGGKSLIKRDPYEKAGVFCLRNNRPSVVEYTEITREMAEMRNADGDYVYGDAHILCNMFRRDTLEQMGSEGLPYHTARKKTPYVDADGNSVTPDRPNAYKFEAFIFDAFSRCPQMGILRVDRESEFAPVKNRDGEDSPETARALYLRAMEAGALD